MLGHIKAQQFKFYVDAMDCPVMKYKLLCTDDDWLLRDGGIKLWKEDSQGQALWPRGYPEAVKPYSMRNLEDIKRGLQGLLTTGTNCLKRTQQESTVGGMNLLATIGDV